MTPCNNCGKPLDIEFSVDLHSEEGRLAWNLVCSVECEKELGRKEDASLANP